MNQSSASAFSASVSASQKPQENAQYPPSMNQSSAHLPHSTCWRHVKSPGGGASQQRSSAPSEPQACPEVSACESAASAFRAASSPALAASFSSAPSEPQACPEVSACGSEGAD